jgi:hypothetical protein
VAASAPGLFPAAVLHAESTTKSAFSFSIATSLAVRKPLSSTEGVAGIDSTNARAALAMIELRADRTYAIKLSADRAVLAGAVVQLQAPPGRNVLVEDAKCLYACQNAGIAITGNCTLLHSGNNHVIYADQQILWRAAGLLGVGSAVEYRVRELTRFANALGSHQ